MPSKEEHRKIVIDMIRSGCTRIAAEIADESEFPELIALYECEEKMMHGSPSEKQQAIITAKDLERSLDEKYGMRVLHYNK